jgi:hypothetical protein
VVFVFTEEIIKNFLCLPNFPKPLPPSKLWFPFIRKFLTPFENPVFPELGNKNFDTGVH